MGLEFTRGNSARCPPLLVGGLMVMCLFLLCSWWSLSSQNFELLRQNDNLAEQLRINGDELRKYKEQSAELEVQIKRIREADQETQFQCQTELESLKKLGESKEKNLEALRANEASLKKDLETEKERADEFERQLKSRNETIIKLEKDLEDKQRTLLELETKAKALKTTNTNDLKSPVLSLLRKNQKGISDNQKIADNDVLGVYRSGNNQDSAVIHDENNGGEAKNEDPAAEPGDPREQEMGNEEP